MYVNNKLFRMSSVHSIWKECYEQIYLDTILPNNQQTHFLWYMDGKNTFNMEEWNIMWCVITQNMEEKYVFIEKFWY